MSFNTPFILYNYDLLGFLNYILNVLFLYFLYLLVYFLYRNDTGVFVSDVVSSGYHC